MAYVLIWIMVTGISFWLFKKSAGSMSLLKPNLLSITYYYSLLSSSYIGALLIALKIDHHYMIKLLSRDSFRVEGFIIISFIMIFLPLTMFVINKLFGFNAEREYNNYLKAPVAEDGPFSNDVVYIYSGLTGIALLAILYTAVQLKHIPIFDLFMGSDQLGKLRIEASHDFSGSNLIKNIFATSLTTLLSMITFVYAYKSRKIIWKLLFAATLLGAIFMQIYYLAKGPIFFYALMFLMLLIYIRVIKLTAFKVIILGMLGSALLITMYIFIQGVTDPSQFLSYNKGPIGRLILSQIAPFYLHLDLFTDRLPLLMGKSLPSTFLGLYDIDQIRSAKLAMEAFFPQRVEAGTAGVLNTLYAAEAFANFGLVGVVLGTFYIGVFMQIIYLVFIRLPKNPLFVSLFVFFTVNIPRVVIGGFVDFLFNPLWIALVFILFSPFVFIYLYRKLRGSFNKKEEKVLG